MSQRIRLRRGAVTVLAALGAMGAVAVFAATPSLASRSRDAKASFLYVLQAKDGWAAKQPNGHWRLSLVGVSMFEFSDRPKRVAKALPVDLFVSDFKRLFAGSPPNGAFVVQHAPAGQPPTAVEMFRAFWEKPGELGLCMCTIGSQPGAVRWLSQLTRSTAREHGEITLFIDNAACCQYAPDRAWRRSRGG